MGLESVTYVDDLVTTNPVGATDPKSEGDNHIRNLKTAIKAAVQASAASTALKFGGASLLVLTAGIVTLSSANLALGANYISRAGTAAGLSLDASNNATFSADLTVNGGDLTIGGNADPSLVLSPSSGATKTGKWHQVANVVYLADSGVADRWQLDLATGNVTNSGNLTVNGATFTMPGGYLDITRNDANALFSITNAQSSKNWWFGVAGTGSSLGSSGSFGIRNQTNSILALEISATGNTTLSGTLTVSGASITLSPAAGTANLQITAANGAVAQQTFTQSGVGNWVSYFRVSDGAYAIQYGGTDRVSVSNTGNLTVAGATITTGSTTALSLATSGGTQFAVLNTNSVASFVQAKGGTTTNGGRLQISSTDTNADFEFSTQGTGSHRFFTNVAATVEQVRITHTASAVNYVQLSGAATTGYPTIKGVGSDTHVGLNFDTQNAGSLNFRTNSGTQQVTITHTASATRYITLTGSNGGNPTIGVSGGNLAISTSVFINGQVSVASGNGVYLDGGSNTYIIEPSADIISFVGGGTERARITAGGFTKHSDDGTYDNSTGAFHEFLSAQNSTAEYTLILKRTCATATNQYGMKVHLTGDPNDATRVFFTGQGNATERISLRTNGGLANFSANNVNLSDIAVKPYYETIGGKRLSDMWAAHRDTDWGLFKYVDQTHGDLNIGYNAQNIEDKWGAVAPWLVETNETTGLKWVYQEDLHNAGHAVLAEAQRRIEKLEAALVANGITLQ